MSGEISLSKSVIGKTVFGLSVLGTVVTFMFFSSPYTGFLVFTVLLMIWSAYYTLANKKHLSEMCCMMSGMAFGMVGGFFIGTLTGLATGDFVIGMISGTVAGVIFGIPIGKMGGPLGRMEGVMAGPMGGIMGGMTGVMVRFYNVELFMPFFALVVIFTVWEMTRVIHGHSKNISRNFLYIGIIISILAFSSSMANNFGTAGTGLAFAKQPAAQGAAVGDVQEVTIKMQALDYAPNYIALKKDVPARITLEASPDAGCTRSIVFPSFNIRKLVPQGGKTTVEFTPTKAGTFDFGCSMGMATGTVVVQQ